MFSILYFFANLSGEGRGEGVKKIENFKSVIDSSVIHRWKAGVLRFLKTCYTICFQFYSILPIYEGGRGGGEKNSKFQNCHRLKCDTPLESWSSEVSDNNYLFYSFLQYVFIFAHFFVK